MGRDGDCPSPMGSADLMVSIVVGIMQNPRRACADHPGPINLQGSLRLTAVVTSVHCFSCGEAGVGQELMEGFLEEGALGAQETQPPSLLASESWKPILAASDSESLMSR